MTVALSRARLGLYVLGRGEVFTQCTELEPAFSQLLVRPDKLVLVTGEMWPAKREDAADGVVEGEAVMEGVEHLGRFVYEMTRTRLAVGEKPDDVVAVDDEEMEERERLADIDMGE